MSDFTTDMIPVQLRDIGGETIQAINARDIHRGLGVGRDFSNWIKGRIDKGQFKEGMDYIIDIFDRQNGRSTESMAYDGAKTAIDYFVTLDMAKHLALMENNAQGHAYRQRLIDIEKAYRRAMVEGLNGAIDQEVLLHRFGGVMKSVAHKAIEPMREELAETKSEVAALKDHVATLQLESDPRNWHTRWPSVLDLLERYNATPKGRRSLVSKFSRILNDRIPIEKRAQDPATGKWRYPFDMAIPVMEEYKWIIASHNAKMLGQPSFVFTNPTKDPITH